MNIKYLTEWLDVNITDDEISAIEKYTSALGYNINYNLRNNTLRHKYENIVSILDNLFDRIPALKSDITVYRNIDNVLTNYNSNAYTSTTIDIQNMVDLSNKKRDNTQVILEIRVSKGTKIIPLEQFSEHKNEQEILLPRNIPLTVVKETIMYGHRYIYLITLPIKQTPINLEIVNSEIMNIKNILLSNLSDLYQENIDLEGNKEDFISSIEIFLIDYLAKINSNISYHDILSDLDIITQINSYYS
jgi:hypothetical protein